MKKTALVTGASRGIGRAIALQLAKDGFHVLVHYAGNLTAAQQVANEINTMGSTAIIVQADLCAAEQVEAMACTLPDVDVLVLNASVQAKSPWEQISQEAAWQQMQCNFMASLRLIQAVVPYMRQKNWGRIVTIGSVQERKPHPQMLAYSASKAAQTNMVQSLSVQLAKDGITVNNVAPGVIYTDRNMQALSDPEYAKQVMDSIPAGFYGEPKDCAGLVGFLCSEQSRYITGQSIYADGGKSLL